MLGTEVAVESLSLRFLLVGRSAPSVTASKKLLFRFDARLAVDGTGTAACAGSTDTDLRAGVLVARLDALRLVDGVFEIGAFVGVGNERPNSMLLLMFLVLRRC
jgi:hypothetical protein